MQLKFRPSWRALLQASTFLGLALIAFVWVALYFDHARRSEAQEQDARISALSLARQLEKSANGLLKELDRIALFVRDFVEREQGHESFQDMVARTRVMTDLTLQIVLVDAHGLCWATTIQPAPPTNIADRMHFRVHKSSMIDAPFVSVPVVGRISKRWAVQLTRRVSTPEGGFGGIVVISLDPGQLAQYFGTLAADGEHRFSLIGLDGVVRAAGGRNPYALGQNVSDSRLLDRARVEAEDVFFDRPKNDGSGQLVAYRALTDFPLIVAVAKDEAQVFTPRPRTGGILPALVVTCIVIITMVLSARHKHTLVCAKMALADSERQALRKARQLELTLAHMNQGILMVDVDSKVAVINRQAVELLRLPEHYLDTEAEYADVLRVLEQQARGKERPMVGAVRRLADVMRIPNGTNPVPHLEHEDTDGTVLEICSEALHQGGFVRTITDITKRRRSEDRIAHLANHDPLTDLANRVLFHKRLTAALSEIDRGGRFAVLLLDLDQFKDVNDSLGHPFGDELLKRVALRLRGAIRSTDFVARVGGDEFVVIQRDAATAEDCSELARALVEAVSAPYEIDRQCVVIGVSIGIAMAPAHGRDGDELLKAADMALYRAKAEGRGRYSFFTARLNELAQQRRKVEVDLRAALEHNEFEIHYQPVLIDGGETIGSFEALMRWRHPVRGIVSPEEFIPVAEDVGLIVQMGEWALYEACKQATTWPSHVRVAINLSPMQFNSGALKGAILDALAQSGLHPSRLLLEITETTLLRHSPSTLSLLHELRDLGVSIALDDFGTGYSSLSHLQSMPFDALKIDRRFIKGLGTTNDTEPLVRAMIDVANALGMSTTAEGVETRAQLNHLRSLGCQEFQGFLFGRPCPADELAPLLLRYAGGASRPRAPVPRPHSATVSGS